MGRRKYQDFVLSTMPKTLLSHLRSSKRSGRYYYTQFKKRQDGNFEVTFNLPPTILEQMMGAYTAGKKIRVFVPN